MDNNIQWGASMNIVFITSKTYVVKSIPDIVLGHAQEGFKIIVMDCLLDLMLGDKFTLEISCVSILAPAVACP
jgi:hypothetical protein